MNRQGKAGVTLIAGSVAFIAAAGVAAMAGTEASADLPRGPYIDFCPTTEQIEAHLSEFGFDYKPTVPCGEDGKEAPPGPGDEEQPDSEEELFAAEKQTLLTATRAPDKDGDPLTMEIVLADGTRTTIFIMGDPKLFKDMTPTEYAELIYP